jgi:hypothetical protein
MQLLLQICNYALFIRENTILNGKEERSSGAYVFVIALKSS